MAQRPQETLSQLCDIFPSFQATWTDEGAPPVDTLVDGVFYEWTHHAVMRAFLEFFAKNHDAFSETQFRAVGDWINRAVSGEDDLESAVSTCFLEHVRQVGVNRVLWPYLSSAAKRKSRA
jgi:hypothetical protein